MDFSQNGYWHVANMMLKGLIIKEKAEGCCLLGVNGKIFPAAQPVCPWPALGLWAVRRPLMRTGHGRAWAPNTAWLCLPGLSFRGGKQYRTLVLTRYQSALACRRSLQAADRRKLLQAPSRGRLWPHSLDYAGSCSLFHILHQSPGHISFLSWFPKGFPSALGKVTPHYSPRRSDLRCSFLLSVTQPLF